MKPESEIVKEASDWLVLKDEGMAPGDVTRFESWLADDPRHAGIYHEIEKTWEMLADSPHPRPDSVRPRRKIVWPSIAAAAAAVMLGAFTYTRLADPNAYSTEAITQVGGIERMNLPDGSVILLNTDTKLEVRYSSETRSILLKKGEAHFTVAKIPERPFVVNAAGLDVSAIGTSFNVRVKSEQVEVLVTEGKVSVARDALQRIEPIAFVAAGEKTTVPIAGPQASITTVPVVAVEQPSITESLAWRHQQLQFSTQTLAEMVAEFNRYNRHQLVIDDPALGAKRFGGTFPATDQESFVQLLETSFDVHAERQRDRTILREIR